MTDLATFSTPKQMKTIITLLNLVKSELYITIDHAERCIEMFISERQSYASLQQFIQALQQIRGTLTLIEISGATQLADLMLNKALTIPTGADKSWDQTLTVLSTALFTLRRYIENFESYPCSLPELLIPTINELRKTNNQPPLADSYFTDINITHPKLPYNLPVLADIELFGRLRQMYEIGLLGLIKDSNRDASLRMMIRSIDRLQKHLDNENASLLCWVTAAALESFTDSAMTAFPTRKRLFSRVDQQLRKTQINHEPINNHLLKDLLYMVSLDNTLGPKAFNVFNEFNLKPLPYNNNVLETEIAKLAGPGQSAICSFTAAIREELEHTQTTIDSFTSNGSNPRELIEALLVNLEHLIKTLSLVNIQNAETMLKEQIGILEIHKKDVLLNTHILDNLADVILHVEGIITGYETNAACGHNEKVVTDVNIEEDNINQYLKQGRQLAIEESLIAFGTAQQNIIAYIESNGDKQYLEKLPQILNENYGCLLFLNQDRAAEIIYQCKYYIDTQMINTSTIPPTKDLDNLADILASLEFFMETETLNKPITESKVLDLAEESLIALKIPESVKLAYAEHNKTNHIEPVRPSNLTSNQQELAAPLSFKSPATATTTDSSAISSKNNEINKVPSETLKNIESLEFDFKRPLAEELTISPQTIERPKVKTSPTAIDLALDPIDNFSKEQLDTEEKPQKVAAKPVDDDDDDIKFTGPENWKLL